MWLSNEVLLENIAKDVAHPISEVFVPRFQFCDYRLSYGVSCYNPSTIYFMAIYPAFCVSAKAVFHYNDIADLSSDLNAILDIFAGEDRLEGYEVKDVIAAVFALSREKESIELFQEQKDFMELGVKHIHLDNYYQDKIKKLCTSYYETGSFSGFDADVSFLKERERDGTKPEAQ